MPIPVLWMLQALQALEKMKWGDLPEMVFCSILSSDLSALAKFALSNRANISTHAHIEITTWDNIALTAKMRNLQ
jgi:hypothetical protein